jgi:hypothetical protein
MLRKRPGANGIEIAALVLDVKVRLHEFVLFLPSIRHHGDVDRADERLADRFDTVI